MSDINFVSCARHFSNVFDTTFRVPAYYPWAIYFLFFQIQLFLFIIFFKYSCFFFSIKFWRECGSESLRYLEFIDSILNGVRGK